MREVHMLHLSPSCVGGLNIYSISYARRVKTCYYRIIFIISYDSIYSELGS
jgi:hypothetical protein